ncbi:ABC transporter permease [Sphingomonas sp.]|uniref:ABC transporter permease n=1 Tax=Sphingomonas sp. TaxID=28214 RepID=UPI002DBC72F2|nr:ABC transporter permease [Sphingomonas sp.]HEU4969770.1 ABC transporter permease [Sphingomonas sp.]
MIRFLRSAMVIARRDFTATVLSKAFIFFLLAPLFPLLMGGVFGGIGARVATQAQRPVIAVVAPRAEFAGIAAARSNLAQATSDDAVVRLVNYAPETDLAAQQKRLLASRNPPIQAVLTGASDDFQLVGDVHKGDSTDNQLRLMLHNAAAAESARPSLEVEWIKSSSPGSLVKDRAVTAQIGQMLLFFLTILLSGMLLSQLIEEKSNKIIEVIAAAVPIDALFVGKLFAMLAASVLGIIVWLSAGALLIQFIKQGGVQTLPPPAVGWPGFLLLSVVYFAMNYMLLGAAFLTIGAQASTVREVQTMSMPITFGQVLIFGFASTVIGSPDSAEGLAAAVFPLSSPMAMLARAAEQPDWWPHLVAIAWQGLWVALILRTGAHMFRKTVLKSGPRTRWWKRKSVA